MGQLSNLKNWLLRRRKQDPKPPRSVYGPEDTRVREDQATEAEFDMELAKIKGWPRGM